MYFNYQYTVTYKSGESFTTKDLPTVELDEEQYYRLVRALKEKPELDNREEIADIVSAMKENVLYIDRWTNKNGSMRTTPLKKPRDITDIHLFVRREDLSKILKYPVELLDRPEEKLTVYGSDGKTITISRRFGEVRVSDGRFITVFDADRFIEMMTR